MNLFEFEIPAHTTGREWAVYIIVATHKIEGNKLLYVGKVGDNRDGCNPIISRLGNHFSYNPIHSQMRNKVPNTTDFNYKIHYCTLGFYDKDSHTIGREKINEVERRLNTIVFEKSEAKIGDFKLLNPFEGKSINKAIKEKRQKLLTDDVVKILEELADNALKN